MSPGQPSAQLQGRRLDVFTSCKYTLYMDVTHTNQCGTFEWDSDKEARNRRKHGLDFALAAEAFADVCAVYRRDTAQLGGGTLPTAWASWWCASVAGCFYRKEFHTHHFCQKSYKTREKSLCRRKQIEQKCWNTLQT